MNERELTVRRVLVRESEEESKTTMEQSGLQVPCSDPCFDFSPPRNALHAHSVT